MSTNSVYIHIPFCSSKCNYCAFTSFVDKNEFKESYLQTLIKEINATLKPQYDKDLSTLYIGGGTPSTLNTAAHKEIISALKSKTRISPHTEITMELNPDLTSGMIDLEYFKQLRSAGINRLSIGVQSFDDNILKILNRKHTSKEAIETIKLAKQAGFSNISIDLIYGLPQQDLENWKTTLTQATELDIQHISAYGLKIEEGTRFAENTFLNFPDEDLCADMYIYLLSFLKEKGFNHYEISNFSKEHKESAHNKTYWKNKEYYAFGVSAHGYVDGIRYANTSNLEDYLKNFKEKDFSYKVSEQEQVEEGIFLGLRLTEGININNFEQKYKFNILENHKKIVDKHIENNLMTLSEGVLKLTEKGILLSNSILSDFIN